MTMKLTAAHGAHVGSSPSILRGFLMMFACWDSCTFLQRRPTVLQDMACFRTDMA